MKRGRPTTTETFAGRPGVKTPIEVGQALWVLKKRGIKHTPAVEFVMRFYEIRNEKTLYKYLAQWKREVLLPATAAGISPTAQMKRLNRDRSS